MSKLGRLQSVELRKIWPDEAQNFTPWLVEEENLILLGETLGMDLELEAKEIYVGDFRADILCRDTEDNSLVLVENQLEETNHRHLGQILTYAAGLDAHTVIWIAKKFREEHRAALDHLNEITNENFQYFGIELKVWQIGNSARAPQFDIVSSPNDWNSAVDRGKRNAEDEGLSEIKGWRRKIWKQLCDYAAQKNTPVRFHKPSSAHYLTVSKSLIDRTDFNMEVWLGRDNREIAIRLYMSEQNFYILEKQRKKIEQEFCESLEWEELPQRSASRISLRKGIIDPTDESDWQNQHEWVISKLEKFHKKFHKVFLPRIQELNTFDSLSEHEVDE